MITIIWQETALEICDNCFDFSSISVSLQVLSHVNSFNSRVILSKPHFPSILSLPSILSSARYHPVHQNKIFLILCRYFIFRLYDENIYNIIPIYENLGITLRKYLQLLVLHLYFMGSFSKFSLNMSVILLFQWDHL